MVYIQTLDSAHFKHLTEARGYPRLLLFSTQIKKKKKEKYLYRVFYAILKSSKNLFSQLTVKTVHNDQTSPDISSIGRIYLLPRDHLQTPRIDRNTSLSHRVTTSLPLALSRKHIHNRFSFVSGR